MNNNMKRLLVPILKHWRIITVATLLIIITGLMVGYRLGSLPGNGLASAEIETFSEYSSLRTIISDPTHAPYKLLGWTLSKLPYNSNAMLRIPAAILATLTVLSLAYVMRRWYGTRSTIIGVALFMTSAWFLHVGRAGVYDIEFMWAMTTLILLHVLFHAHAESSFMSFVWLVGIITLLFVPGFIWLVLLNLILQRNDILDAWDNLNALWKKIMFVTLPVIALAGITFLIVRDTSLLKTWLGIPPHPEMWMDILKRLGNAVAYFVVRGPSDPVIWLGRLPVLDVFVTVMLIAGVVFYAKHLKAARIRLLGGLFIAGAILTALNPVIKFSLLVPIAYLVATAGIAYLLHEWLRVFPRNPLARSVGVFIVAVVVSASCLYNLRSYFIAWPHNKATQTTFVKPLPISKN